MSFSHLFTASLYQSDASFLYQFPDKLLNNLERGAIKFVRGYDKLYSKVPTIERVGRTAHSIFLDHELSMSPLADLYELALEQKRQDLFMERYHWIESQMDQGIPLKPEEIIQIGKDISINGSSKSESALTFNRELIYNPEAKSSLLFGFEYLDNATGGIMPGEYALLVARTGVGKTVVTCNLCLRWARAGKKVLFISCEMPTEQILGRIDAMAVGFNPRILRSMDNPMLLTKYKAAAELEMQYIADAGGDIFFPKSRTISAEGLDLLIENTKPDALIVDGVYLLSSDDNSKSSADWQRLKGVSNSIKQMALGYNIPIFATSQLKRTGKDDAYNLEDIAYSDALGQDTDLVLALSRQGGTVNGMCCDIIKNRHGNSYGGSMFSIDWDVMKLVEKEIPGSTLSPLTKIGE